MDKSKSPAAQCATHLDLASRNALARYKDLYAVGDSRMHTGRRNQYALLYVCVRAPTDPT